MNIDVTLEKQELSTEHKRKQFNTAWELQQLSKARRFVLNGSPQKWHKLRLSQNMTNNLFGKDTDSFVHCSGN